MPLDKIKIFEKSKEIATSKKLINVCDVFAALGISKSTWYAFFPDGSDELDTIKDLLNANRINTKTSLRSKWYESDNPTLQLAAYKLLASPDELKSLSMNHTEFTGEGGGAIKVVFNEIRNYESDN